MKYVMRVYLFFFLTALVFFFLGWGLHTPQARSYRFSPNFVFIKKPTLLEILEQPKRVSQVRADSHIVDSHYAKVGAGLRLVGKTLFLIKKEDLSQEYQLTKRKPVGSLKVEKMDFFPQYWGKRYPIPMELLQTQQDVKRVRNNSQIYGYRKAEVGAAVSWSVDEHYWNLIPKKEVQKYYEPPIKLRQYLRKR